MSRARYAVRPLSDRSWLRPAHQREWSPFTAGWSDTLDLLIREVTMLDGQHLVLGIDVREQDFRLDGTLRANARPVATDGVEVAFDSRHGPLLYRCDQYLRRSYQRGGMESWQHNVRAIAMTLQALRAVDRYGAARSGEQYRGYRQLPAGRGDAATGMTVTDAASILLRMARGRAPASEQDPCLTRSWWVQDGASCLRAAKINAHPDRNDGDRGQWNLVDNAEQVLRRAGWLPQALAS